jgi:hypothetical protein
VGGEGRGLTDERERTSENDGKTLPA